MPKHTTLTKEDIMHMARLANLTLSDAEIETYLGQLEQTITHINNLAELDTSTVEGSASSVQFENRTFEDGSPNTRGLDMSHARFVVPRLIAE